jgi:hypothetical protein
LASTAITKPSLASVVTAMKSFYGSNGSFLNTEVAVAMVDELGAISTV